MLQAFEKEKTAIDVFDRYFIPSYYANTRKAVSDFVTEDLKETINVRLTYSLKKSVKAPYGYLITTQPKTQKYPNN